MPSKFLMNSCLISCFNQMDDHIDVSLPEAPPSYFDQSAAGQASSSNQPQQPAPFREVAPGLTDSLSILRMPVITTQPGAEIPQPAWMEKPPVPASDDIPAGLEYLVGLDGVRIRQLVELLEIVTPIQMPNRYIIENFKGEQIYVTTEQMNPMRAQFKRQQRAYKFDMYDRYSRLSFRVERPEHSGCCWCGCMESCRTRSIVESPVGTLAGVLTTKQSCCSSRIGIRDGDGHDMLKIDGPSCCGRCCSDSVFHVDSVSRRDPRGATITRKYQGDTSIYTNADVFEIQFLPDLDVRMKASVIGAAILLDFLEFEGIKGNKHNQSA